MNLKQDTAQISQTRAVELKLFNCCPTSWRQPDDHREVLVPGKMIAPLLASWAKQLDILTRQRIDGENAHVFAVVATLARESKIVWFACTTQRQRRDVFDREKSGENLS